MTPPNADNAHSPSFIKTPPASPSRTTILFSVTDGVGALESALSLIKNLNISLTRIESRPSKAAKDEYEFFIDFHTDDSTQVPHVTETLRKAVKEVKVVSTDQGNGSKVATVPWFPRKKSDLDTFADKVLSYGEELDADHPGFTDPAYRKRRADITALARTYRTGMPLPHIDYTKEEIDTWATVFNKLTQLYPTHACREHCYIFPLLVQNCGYRPDNIPQIEDISKFLKECTGFTLRPVMGLLSSRDFLNGLAFRVFHSTQYIRHHSKPLYTPEPDVCHELLGHVPLFADPDFADFSQEIGLASLGAAEGDIEKLATIYWFTVEFGLCKEGDNIKAYGAGLLSSFGELEYCLSDKPEKLTFDPFKASTLKYPITQYQPVYFVADSFRSAKEKVREFAKTLDRPFEVRYNALAETIEVLDSKDKVVRYAQNIRSDMQRLINALERM